MDLNEKKKIVSCNSSEMFYIENSMKYVSAYQSKGGMYNAIGKIHKSKELFLLFVQNSKY